MLVTILVALLAVGILVALYLRSVSKKEVEKQSDEEQIRQDVHEEPEEVPAAASEPADAPSPEPQGEEVQEVGEVPEEPVVEEPVVDEPVVEAPVEAVKPEETPQPPPVLPRINPRDELPRFYFPQTEISLELFKYRMEGVNPHSLRLPILIGKDEDSQERIIDLSSTPNLFIAGSRACYDSVVRSLKLVVYSLLMTRHPSEVKLVLMDAHHLDFMGYEKLLYHYLACTTDSRNEKEERENCIVSSPDKAFQVLFCIKQEIDDRIKLLQKARCRNIEQYNEQYLERHLLPTEGHHYMPYIVVVVNEYAEFVSLSSRNRQPFLDQIVRIAHVGKAAGIHLVLGTTYILRDLIPKELIDSFPGVVAYRVNSGSESKILIGEVGAENQRDTESILFKDNVDIYPMQTMGIPDVEFDYVVDVIGHCIGYQRSYYTPYYLPEPWDPDSDDSGGMIDLRMLDERFEEAARLVVTSQRGSTSDLQRRLGMGYAKAGLVMDQLEAAGIVGPQNGSKPREVLVKDFKELDQILSHFLSNS